MKKLHILADAGHTVNTNGKRVVMNNGVVFYEWQFNKAMLDHIISICKEKGIKCSILPNLSIENLLVRASVFNKMIDLDYVNLFMSIHADYFNDRKASGTSVFTTRGYNNSDLLAQFVIDHLHCAVLKIRTDRSDGDDDFERDFTIIKEVNCPSVLIECGFMSNAIDVSKLCDYVYQRLMAEQIVNGFEMYYNYSLI